MSYDCMTLEEYSLWARQVARAKAVSPCYDCPLWFEMQARQAGFCSRKTTPERRAKMLDRHRRKGAQYECNGTEASVAILRPGPLHS